MRVHVHQSAEAAAAETARLISETVRERREPVLGLATGGTMQPVYAGLVAAHRAGLSFAGLRSFNLDEYVGLPPDHPQSYRHYMQVQFFDHVDVPPDRIHVPRGDLDPDDAAAAFEAELAQHGPIDLQLLGLGRNGHIGFNEPGAPAGSRTRQVRLAPSTIEANRRFFDRDQSPPEVAVTMGIATILEARSIVLLAVGADKAQAVAAMLEGAIGVACPGSLLRRHSDVTVILDTEAASGLSGD